MQTFVMQTGFSAIFVIFCSLGNGYSYPTGASQCPESEGLLNGPTSFDRNLRICSEHDGLLANEVSDQILQDVESIDEESGIVENAEDMSDNEINIVSQKPSEHVALSIGAERPVLPLHSL